MTITAATPVEKFGKDHWSLLAYAEDRCVHGREGLGMLSLSVMSCNGNKRPLMGAMMPWRDSYSTRLKGFFEFFERHDTAKAVAAGVQLLGHDDWDSLDDLEAAGFLEIISQTQGAVRFTTLGSQAAAALREHKTKGGQMSTFNWQALASDVAPVCAEKELA